MPFQVYTSLLHQLSLKVNAVIILYNLNVISQVHYLLDLWQTIQLLNKKLLKTRYLINLNSLWAMTQCFRNVTTIMHTCIHTYKHIIIYNYIYICTYVLFFINHFLLRCTIEDKFYITILLKGTAINISMHGNIFKSTKQYELINYFIKVNSKTRHWRNV